jgi:predicted SAM-dependent methyltransferase
VPKLNIGCGSTKIKGCINIDTEKKCKPDLVHNILKAPLPFKNKYADEIYLFHTIEHIRKMFHRTVLKEIHRVLKPNGVFMVSFPEFLKCVRNWELNKDDLKQFWEMTIFGRQLYPADHHVCIMDSREFVQVLLEIGFKDIKCTSEPDQDFNTIISCKKGIPFLKYEEMLSKDIAKFQLTGVDRLKK